MPFDVQGARKAGYSDQEIVDHLARSQRFDAAEARKSGYSDAEIIEHLNSQIAQKPKRSAAENVTGFMANVNRGLAVGDEMAAGFSTAAGLLTGRHRFGADKPGNVVVNNLRMIKDAYESELAGQREREDTFAEERPLTAALARGTGNALTVAAPIGPGAQAFQGGSVAVNALRGATLAGATGAGYAALDRGTAEERLAAASSAARDPVTLGMGAGMGALATAKPRPRRERPATPTLDELKAQKSAAYKAVEDSGHTFSPAEVQRLAKDVADDLGRAKIHPVRHKNATSMMEDITALAADGEPMTLNQLDQLRQVVRRDVANSTDDAEAFMGRRIIQQIDRFIDAAGGDGASTVRAARDLNTRVRKMEGLDEAVEHAGRLAAGSGTGGNIDNATRQGVRRFLEQTPNLTPEEVAAAERVIRGTRGQNALRQLGRLSPQGNGLMQAGHLAALGPSGGASAGVAGLGAVSRVVADAITRRNVQVLRDLIAEGGAPAARQIVNELEIAAAANPAARELQAQLANDLAAAMGVQGASRRGAVEAYLPDRPDYGVGAASPQR